MRGIKWALLAGISLSAFGCVAGPDSGGSGKVSALNAASKQLDSSTSSSPCGSGLTGVITATSAAGAVPGVSQYLCASTAIVPPFNGSNPSTGGATRTFSFGPTAPASATSLDNTMTFQISGSAPGSYDISKFTSYVMVGYWNSGFCAAPAGTITVSSLSSGSAVGTFTASAICDKSGTVQLTNVSGNFHIP